MSKQYLIKNISYFLKIDFKQEDITDINDSTFIEIKYYFYRREWGLFELLKVTYSLELWEMMNYNGSVIIIIKRLKGLKWYKQSVGLFFIQRNLTSMTSHRLYGANWVQKVTKDKWTKLFEALCSMMKFIINIKENLRDASYSINW